MLDRYVETELWLEVGRYVATEPYACSVARLGRYVATEPWLEVGRYVATALGLSMVRLPYSSLPVVGSDTCRLPWRILICFELRFEQDFTARLS